MVIRVTWGKLRAGSWNEFERTYRANVLTKGKGLKGLRGRWLAQDARGKGPGLGREPGGQPGGHAGLRAERALPRDHGAAPAVLRGRVQDLSLRREVHRRRRLAARSRSSGGDVALCALQA